jgi:AcrR family transcriptional regulator
MNELETSYDAGRAPAARERLVAAAVALLRAADPEALTLARVAAAAGMSERTLYRHFGSRDELLAEVWARVNRELPAPPAPHSAAELAEHPRALFPRFDADEALVRAVVHTRQGRELRQATQRSRRARIRRAVREARPELDDRGLTRMCAVVQLLGSAAAWSAMRDDWGLDGEQAGVAAAEAIARLLAPPPRGAEVGR